MTDAIENRMEDAANAAESEYERKLEAEADEALDRIQRGQSWDDWLKIGELFVHGRKQAMLFSHVNKPEGKGYNLWFSGWMARHPKLQAIDKATRNHAMQCFDNAAAIKEWRGHLAQNQREAINHPTTVLRRWKREQADDAVIKVVKKKTDRQGMIEQIDLLEADNKKLRARIEQGEANVFSMADTPENIGKLLADPTMCGLEKARKIHKALGEAISKRAKFEAERKKAGPR